ncbi:MAG: hypothetical protein L3K17_09565 [Thermoplasmata archaeon]|nr:hypothetical protein [Thermoplasmata archaeon]
MARKEWRQRVGRRRYQLNPARHGPDVIADTDPLWVGARIVRPYYFGFATAAGLLGVLPQASRTYYLVTPTRTTTHLAHAARFHLVHVRPKRFFGTRALVRPGSGSSLAIPSGRYWSAWAVRSSAADSAGSSAPSKGPVDGWTGTVGHVT